MYSSPKMTTIITKIAEKHGLDLTTPGSAIKLKNGPYMDLCIECVGPNQVAVGHVYTQNGDVMYDPEIVFFTGYLEWVPIEITQHPVGVYNRCANLNDDSSAIVTYAPKTSKSVRQLANLWARNLKSQGWVDDSEKV